MNTPFATLSLIALTFFSNQSFAASKTITLNEAESLATSHALVESGFLPTITKGSRTIDIAHLVLAHANGHSCDSDQDPYCGFGDPMRISTPVEGGLGEAVNLSEVLKKNIDSKLSKEQLTPWEGAMGTVYGDYGHVKCSWSLKTEQAREILQKPSCTFAMEDLVEAGDATPRTTAPAERPAVVTKAVNHSILTHIYPQFTELENKEASPCLPTGKYFKVTFKTKFATGVNHDTGKAIYKYKKIKDLMIAVAPNGEVFEENTCAE